MRLTYAVVLLPEREGGFTVEVPALSGCFSRGETINEALRNAEEAMRCHLESIIQHNDEIPREGDTVPLATEDLTEAIVFRVSVTLEKAQVA